MKGIIIDAILDSIKLLPFLFIAFLIIELFEHKLKTNNLKKTGKFGPIIGSILGLFPQCGFSVMATNLYATRIITLGTLISVYLSCSDEVIPVLLATGDIKTIIKILIIKLIIGIIFGIIIDIFIKRKKTETNNYHICTEDSCHCERGIIISSLIHTIKTFIFIFIITLIIDIIFEYSLENFILKIFKTNTLFSPLITSLIGFIPNCASSILISELYIKNIISFGACISGLLTGSGLALIILFKTNKNIKENIFIMTLLYVIGVLVGLIIELLNI